MHTILERRLASSERLSKRSCNTQVQPNLQHVSNHKPRTRGSDEGWPVSPWHNLMAVYEDRQDHVTQWERCHVDRHASKRRFWESMSFSEIVVAGKQAIFTELITATAR